MSKISKIVILILILGLSNISCASQSEHWKEKRLLADAFGNPVLDSEGNKQEVEVDVIKQRGIIKAKHPTGAEGESKPWIEFPQVPLKIEQ